MNQEPQLQPHHLASGLEFTSRGGAQHQTFMPLPLNTSSGVVVVAALGLTSERRNDLRLRSNNQSSFHDNAKTFSPASQANAQN